MKVLQTILHCHAHGVHSLLLRRDPVVRLFVCDESHMLHRNGLGYGVGAQRFAGQSIGFHRHAYDLTLVHVRGLVWNVLGFELPHETRGNFYRCTYRSEIRDGGGQLVATGQRQRLAVDHRPLEPDDPHEMRSDELHTVAVEEGKYAAWLVCETQIVKPPNLDVFTMNPRFNAEDLYGSGDEQHAARLLGIAGRDDLEAAVASLQIAGWT